jgi:adenine/guanine phosphoribosyltransferase-like PRPP-binding protein
MPPQLSAFIASVLPQADQVLRSGQLAPHLNQAMILEVLSQLEPQLPQADVILALETDAAAFVFELSLFLRIPFISAKILDLVSSDDTESGAFLQDHNLHQVRCEQDTLAMVRGAIAQGSRVLIFRDVLSTGITTLGLLHLVNLAGAETVGVVSLIEKAHLGGRSRLAMQGVAVFAAVKLTQKHQDIIFEQRSHGVQVLHKPPSNS